MNNPVSEPASYRLAGQTILFGQSVPVLQPFDQGDSPFHLPNLPETLQDLEAAIPVLQTTGMLADRISTISVWSGDYGTLLAIPSAGRFWVAADGSEVFQVSPPSVRDPVFEAEAILGPPLVLALAMQGIWCLHASAIEYRGQVIAFLGVSGAGKSTLAAFLAGLPAVRRVSDDILPIKWKNDRLCGMPHFPQLKIPKCQQPGLEFPEQLPLSAIYLLDEQPAIAIQAFGLGKAALTLAGHTVAARLFERRLLGQHFNFCGQAASNLPIRCLAYPRRLPELPSVWQALKDDLDGLHG